MATKLTNPFEREINLPGIDVPIILTFSPQGIRARVKGSRTVLVSTWLGLINCMNTPSSVPSYLMGKPLETLVRKAKEISIKNQGTS